MNDKISTRLNVGQIIAPFEVTTLAHGVIEIPGSRFFHLQFRRFAGCPVCNLHLKSFASAAPRLAEAGITTVAFFHSDAELMRPYQGDLPFPTVPDAKRKWYKVFGVERSIFSVARPGVVLSALRGMATAPSNPFAGGLDQTGLPADFLLSEQGEILALHYGAHADDQWTVEQLLALSLQSRVQGEFA